MKKIELKKIDDFEYKALLTQLVSTPDTEPYSVPQIRQAVKVLDKLEVATDSLLLEDAEFSFVNQRVQSAKFVRADKRILQFVDDISAALEVSVNELSSVS